MSTGRSLKRKADGAPDGSDVVGAPEGLSALARKLLRGPEEAPHAGVCSACGAALPRASRARDGESPCPCDGSRCGSGAGAGAGAGCGCEPESRQRASSESAVVAAPALDVVTADADGPGKQLEKISLLQLVQRITAFFASDQGKSKDSLRLKKPVQELLSAYDVTTEDYKRYAFFDKRKAYTRNLVATDNKHFTLMLLCWNNDKESPIHDHPCDGCWLKIVKGRVRETRYRKREGRLEQFYSEVATAGEVAYMHDCMGYHKVGADGEDSITLHLYSPPYSECRVFLDESDASRVVRPTATHYSEYGEKIVDWSA